MIQALQILVQHPLFSGFLILCFMGIVGMTYEFILKLFSRQSLIDKTYHISSSDEDDSYPPNDASDVYNPDGPK